MQFSSICCYIFSWTILGQMSLMVVISHSSSPYGRVCRWLWWSYICMTNLLIRPFFQTRGYGSRFIFQFLILAMALLGTGIVLLLAHNHLCLSPQYYRFGVFRLRSWVGLPTHFLCLSILSGNFEIMVLHLSPFLVPGDGSHCSNF